MSSSRKFTFAISSAAEFFVSYIYYSISYTQTVLWVTTCQVTTGSTASLSPVCNLVRTQCNLRKQGPNIWYWQEVRQNYLWWDSLRDYNVSPNRKQFIWSILLWRVRSAGWKSLRSYRKRIWRSHKRLLLRYRQRCRLIGLLSTSSSCCCCRSSSRAHSCNFNRMLCLICCC